MKEINLDNIFFNHTGCHPNSRIYTAMKEACRQTVELCAENAIPYRTNEDQIKVDKNSILNTINKIV